jgi:ribose/xylose/arabinose/galactoside ABC-type transport system permease subunit
MKGRTYESEDDFRKDAADLLGEEERTSAGEVAQAAETFKPVGLGVVAVAIAGTLAVGFLIGSLHAWLITVVRLPPFVATLATLVGLRSLGRAVLENVTASVPGLGKSTQIQIFDTRFRYLTTSVWIPVVLFAVLAALAWLLMSKTVVGRHLHALGGNEQAARLSGIRTDRLKWLAYCLSAVLAALAGILYVCEESVANPQDQGRGYELNAIAAAVVGGCSLQGGVGTIPGAVLGALFLRTVIDAVAKIIKTGADVYEGLIVGGLVVIAVAFTRFRQAVGQGREFFPGALGWVTVVNLALLTGLLTALFTGQWSLGVPLGVGAVAVLTVAKLFEKRLGDWLAARRAAGPPGGSDEPKRPDVV